MCLFVSKIKMCHARGFIEYSPISISIDLTFVCGNCIGSCDCDIGRHNYKQSIKIIKQSRSARALLLTTFHINDLHSVRPVEQYLGNFVRFLTTQGNVTKNPGRSSKQTIQKLRNLHSKF